MLQLLQTTLHSATLIGRTYYPPLLINANTKNIPKFLETEKLFRLVLTEGNISLEISPNMLASYLAWHLFIQKVFKPSSWSFLPSKRDYKFCMIQIFCEQLIIAQNHGFYYGIYLGIDNALGSHSTPITFSPPSTSFTSQAILLLQLSCLQNN